MVRCGTQLMRYLDRPIKHCNYLNVMSSLGGLPQPGKPTRIYQATPGQRAFSISRGWTGHGNFPYHPSRHVAPPGERERELILLTISQ